jgi:hypothetical protein
MTIDELLAATEEHAFVRYCSCADEDMTGAWVRDHDRALTHRERACYHSAYQRATKWRDAISHLAR